MMEYENNPQQNNGEILRLKNFKLMDENKMGDHDYTDKMAYDYDHLSYRGAQELSKRLDSLIRAWDK